MESLYLPILALYHRCVIIVALEFKEPVETFGVEAEAIVTGAISDVESKNSFEPVVFWVNKADLGDLYFSAALGTKSDRSAMSEN